MRSLLFLLTLLLLTACGSKKFYTFGENLDIQSQNTHLKSIDVLRVKVPKYLKEHKIVRQVSAYEIELIDNAQWLNPMEKRLTDILISYLQQSMNNPNVHLYPWDSDNKTSTRVELNIKRFIATNNNVILKANYKIVNTETQAKKIMHFQTMIKTNTNIPQMMQSMEKAYLELLEQMKIDIIKHLEKLKTC